MVAKKKVAKHKFAKRKSLDQNSSNSNGSNTIVGHVLAHAVFNRSDTRSRGSRLASNSGGWSRFLGWSSSLNWSSLGWSSFLSWGSWDHTLAGNSHGGWSSNGDRVRSTLVLGASGNGNGGWVRTVSGVVCDSDVGGGCVGPRSRRRQSRRRWSS